MAALSCLLLLGLMPPMEMSSPYAVGSSVPANVIGTEARKEVITYCPNRGKNRQRWAAAARREKREAEYARAS